jgi:hypothetical protein
MKKIKQDSTYNGNQSLYDIFHKSKELIGVVQKGYDTASTSAVNNRINVAYELLQN